MLFRSVHAVLCAEKALNEPFTVINSDDFYGRTSYEIMGKYLSSVSVDSTEHSMVGYKLSNTMSLMGSVSRGVCVVKDGFLVNMRENTKIEYAPEGKIVSHLPEGDVFLTGDETVSMNFFGFTPVALDFFGKYFRDFIKENLLTAKGESLLPNAASEIVTKGLGKIKVFSTPERWFGMTYKEDKEIVHQNLMQKTQEGYYPEKLWEND